LDTDIPIPDFFGQGTGIYFFRIKEEMLVVALCYGLAERSVADFNAVFFPNGKRQSVDKVQT
jgi:hypothetical protein